MLSKEQLRFFSNRWQIDEATILREYLQVVFLFYLYRQKGSSKIFFKGGTAIKLLLNSFRVSEDLDFLSTLCPKHCLAIFEQAAEEMKKEIPGLILNSIRIQYKSLTARLKYQPEGTKHPQTVYLEVSFREKPLLPSTQILETSYSLSSPFPIVSYLGWEEILAEKVRAFIIRSKGRDIFDLWFLLSKKIPLKIPLINKKLKLYKKKIPNIQPILKKIKGVSWQGTSVTKYYVPVVLFQYTQ